MLRLIPYISDVYKQNPDGSTKLVAKKLLRHSQIEMDLIDDVTEYVNDKGKIDPTLSLITHKELGTIIAAIPVQELWNLRAQQNGFIIKGFKIEEDNGKKQTSKPKRTGTKGRTRTSVRRNGAKARKTTTK